MAGMDGRTAGRMGSNANVLNQNMSRGGFVKTVGVGAAGLTGIAMAKGGAASAAGGTITVRGTRKYPADLQNVQTAVDNYKTVILSGTFDFGPGGDSSLPNTVWIRHPMTLTGELRSKIIGSHVPIVCVSPGVTIQNLTLEE